MVCLREWTIYDRQLSPFHERVFAFLSLSSFVFATSFLIFSVQFVVVLQPYPSKRNGYGKQNTVWNESIKNIFESCFPFFLSLIVFFLSSFLSLFSTIHLLSLATTHNKIMSNCFQLSTCLHQHKEGCEEVKRTNHNKWSGNSSNSCTRWCKTKAIISRDDWNKFSLLLNNNFEINPFNLLMLIAHSSLGFAGNSMFVLSNLSARKIIATT